MSKSWWQLESVHLHFLHLSIFPYHLPVGRSRDGVLSPAPVSGYCPCRFLEKVVTKVAWTRLFLLWKWDPKGFECSSSLAGRAFCPGVSAPLKVMGLLEHPRDGQFVSGSQFLAGALQSPISTRLPLPGSSACQNPFWVPRESRGCTWSLAKCALWHAWAMAAVSSKDAGSKEVACACPASWGCHISAGCRDICRGALWPVGLSSQPQSGTHHLLATWEVIALHQSNSSAGSELPWVSKRVVEAVSGHVLDEAVGGSQQWPQGWMQNLPTLVSKTGREWAGGGGDLPLLSSWK